MIEGNSSSVLTIPSYDTPPSDAKGTGRSLKSWLALSQADTSRLPPGMHNVQSRKFSQVSMPRITCFLNPDSEKMDPRWVYYSHGGQDSTNKLKKDSLCVNIN